MIKLENPEHSFSLCLCCYSEKEVKTIRFKGDSGNSTIVHLCGKCQKELKRELSNESSSTI